VESRRYTAAAHADVFKNYVVKHGIATIKEVRWADNTAGGAQMGDIIGYDWNNGADGVLDHLAIVTFRNQHGYPFVSQHSSPRLNRYWSWDTSKNSWIEHHALARVCTCSTSSNSPTWDRRNSVAVAKLADPVTELRPTAIRIRRMLRIDGGQTAEQLGARLAKKGHEATGRGGSGLGSAMGAHYRHTTPEAAARVTTGIEARPAVVLSVAEEALQTRRTRSLSRML
jgi:hypothetical protein